VKERIEWSMIHSLSLNMAELAKDENWERLVEVERHRNQLIQQYFAQPEPHSVSESDILKVLELDKLIMEKCLFKRKSIGEKLRMFSSSRRAKNAYLANKKANEM